MEGWKILHSKLSIFKKWSILIVLNLTNTRSISAFASREMLLPDIGMVHGRMIVTAWDYGLDKVEDNAVRLLMKAVEVWADVESYI